METRSIAMKIRSGNVIYRKFTAISGPESAKGTRAVTKIIKMIIMLNAIIRCFIFNVNTPIRALSGIIKERAFYVNATTVCFYCMDGK
jgi:hypothetical protein